MSACRWLRGGRARLALLTLLLAALLPLLNSSLTREEQRLYRKMEAVQSFLWEELGRRGLERDEEADPCRSGFIGLEWSMTTTSLGSLESKRCSTDPLWAVQMLRWFDELGLKEGDRIAVLASSSFPGLNCSVLAAAEERGLEVVLGVSLGASTWGANRPELPWPVLAGCLRRGGFLRTRPVLYTLGGDNENGGGLPKEARALLTAAAAEDGLPPLQNKTLEEVIAAKTALIQGARLVISVGGSEGNLGENPDVLRLSPGLLMPRPDSGNGGSSAPRGSGLIRLALEAGYPVLHLLNLRTLADACGIAWDTRRPGFSGRGGMVVSVLGLGLFVLFMTTHRRWEWDEDEERTSEPE
ncbi:MAG: poly-gamma-glutamate system protein [Fretibacterium sp.]|nr:poly-gamma-glutamate system protein [Fretibacterium sp.]